MFEIIFDTHDVELDQDMIQDTHLVVGDTPWTAAVYGITEV